MSRKIKLLKIQLTTAVFALVVVLVSGFFIFGPELTQVAKAVIGDYDRVTSGDTQIDTADWDQLDEDFLDKESSSGDTMAGPLTVPEINVTDINISGACTGNCSGVPVVSDIQDVSGNELKMVCGRSYLQAGVHPAGNCWVYNPSDPASEHFLQVRIDTSGASFSSAPIYTASLGGPFNYSVFGLNDINPYSNYFSVRLFYNGKARDGQLPIGGYISDVQAESWGWYIDWCGVGQ